MIRTWKRPLGLVAVIGLSLLVSSCASQAYGHPGDPAFFKGLLHGFIAPFTFIISLFREDVRIYAVPNVGRWYDFGFLLGLSIWGGGGGAAAGRRRP